MPRDFHGRFPVISCFFSVCISGLMVLSSVAVPNKVDAATVRMAFGVSLPPYVIAETASGLEIDVIREALRFSGHELVPVFVPLARVPTHFSQGKVDAVQRDGGNALEGAVYGTESVAYHASFISLAHREIVLESPQDLAELNVISFQNAHLEEKLAPWLEPSLNSGRYWEINDQSLQVLTLHAGRYDVVVADRFIFEHFTKQVERERGTKLAAVKVQAIRGPTFYKPIFREQNIRDDYNAGIKALRESGRYDEIVESYTGPNAAENTEGTER